MASNLAIVASILFFFPIIGRPGGVLLLAAIPPVINILEYIFVVVPAQ